MSDSLRPHSCPTLCDPMDCSLSWDSPGDLPDPGIKLGSPSFQADSVTTKLSGKIKMILPRREQDVGGEGG